METADFVHRAREAASGIQNAGRRVFRNPMSAVLTALAAGFLLGLVLRFFERAPTEREEK